MAFVVAETVTPDAGELGAPAAELAVVDEGAAVLLVVLPHAAKVSASGRRERRDATDATSSGPPAP